MPEGYAECRLSAACVMNVMTSCVTVFVGVFAVYLQGLMSPEFLELFVMPMLFPQISSLQNIQNHRVKCLRDASYSVQGLSCMVAS